MRDIKILIYIIIILSGSSIPALSVVTPSAPSNIIQSIASSTSFTSTAQNTSEAASQIQNITSTVIDSEEISEAVDEAAETFGQQANNAVNEKSSEEEGEVLVTLGGDFIEKALEFPEPNPDTLVYDTGLMNLSLASGAQYSADTTNIFDATAGKQQGRIKVYIDFKRKKQWGDVETRITLNGEDQFTPTTFVGGARDISGLNFPIDSQLDHTVKNDGTIMPIANTPWPPNKHSIASLLLDNPTPTLAPYFNDSEAELADMQKHVSHGVGGENNIIVQTQFTTAGNGAPGTSTLGFEVINMAACSNSSACSDIEKATFATSVVRYDATVTTEATVYKSD
ncbi:hypothetical protein N8700_00460 [Candidatus Pelagibacter sp.]|nr:hypothetical protein [Candidatus Pelagibacter sp.]